MPVKSRGTHIAAPAGRERLAQKRRTRKAIVDATSALVARGTTPSVNEVAAAADVSRRTIYLYFPKFDQLLLDATLGALSDPSIQRVLTAAPADGGPEARVEHLVRAMHHVTPETERLGRALVRLTLDADAKASVDGMTPRGHRRIQWIESALAPLRRTVGPARWRRLVCALAMVVGWEAIIVQRDVCGLSAKEGEELSVWVALALVEAALADARQAGRARARRRPDTDSDRRRASRSKTREGA